jgi:hypothetical protein
MDLRCLAALAAGLLTQPLTTHAEEASADATVSAYFARACADKHEHIAVYTPDTGSLIDITTGSTAGAAAWDRLKFRQLCGRPRLDIYHCHTTDDVLSRFPSGGKNGAPGDFGTAAEMEFACAAMAATSEQPMASLVHGLVTQRGEIVAYGFTHSILERIHDQGAAFGRMLEMGAAREDLKRAEADAETAFDNFNARHFDSFVAFAAKTCPSGDIEHCAGLTVERFASSLPPDDWRFIHVAAAADSPVETVSAPADRDRGLTDTLERIKKEAAAGTSGDRASADQMPALARSLSELDDLVGAQQAKAAVAELTPATLGIFIADGKAIVSVCAESVDGLLPCGASRTRIARLAASCEIKTGILDQDKYPDARYAYPAAKDRSLLLFKTNPRSGMNEHFDLTLPGEPTPQMIVMTLCGALPFGGPSFGQ